MLALPLGVLHGGLVAVGGVHHLALLLAEIGEGGVVGGAEGGVRSVVHRLDCGRDTQVVSRGNRQV